ncbi:MAG: hypothetical protein ACRD8A_00490 [Candidatus Acidiferrales bacterium]
MSRSSGIVAPLSLAVAFLTFIALLLGPVPAHAQSPAAAKPPVEVLNLGPAPQTGGFASIRLTSDERMIAIAGPSGSRMVAYLNGTAGEKYDQILTVPPVLSADGRRSAYAARKGSDWFIVVDGKEYGPYVNAPPYVPLPGGGAQPIPVVLTPDRPIVFSPDSKHFAFVATKGTPQKQETVVVEDGKEISSQGLNVPVSLQFSKQGDHLLYVVRMGGYAWVVVDGVPGFKYAELYSPQFSDDGRHLVYVAQRRPPGNIGPTKITLVVDGKEGAPYAMVGLSTSGLGVLISPDGSHVAYPAHLGNLSSGTNVVVIDGKAIPNATRVWMSPDGKSIPYLLLNPTTYHVKVVVNGKPGLEYATFKDLRFGSGDRVVYCVTASNGKTFVVDGEQESDGYDDADLGSLRFSADGRHMAYIATASGKSFVVLDGKKLTLPPEYSAVLLPSQAVLPVPYLGSIAHEKQLQFTPDGHVFYYVGRYGIPNLVKDDQILGDDGTISPDGRRIATVKISGYGTSTATAKLTLDGKTGPAYRTITRMVFSPDSKHFAYVGTSTTPIPNGTGKEGGFFLVVDGVQKGEYPEISDVRFSPDSQHLFHFVTSHLYGGPGRAYMDQKLFFTFEWLPGYWAQWLDDNHTLQILGGKYDLATRGPADANFYRVRYYLPGAKRDQRTATIPGTGAVDAAEAQRMVGGGGGAAVASAEPAGAASAPVAAGAAGAPTAANAAGAAPVLAPGTSVQVRMIDALDSNNAAGKTYRAAVTRAVTAGSVTIPQGAIATVIVASNGANSTAQLSSITVNGQVIPTSSSSVSVIPSNGAASAAAAQVGSVIGMFGHHHAAAASQVAAMGAHIKLPSGAQLTFVLSAPQ